MSIFRIKAFENPLSIIELDTAIKMVIIAIMPYSAGVNKRAKINPTKKVMPELEILSTKLQPKPLIVLLFNDKLKISVFYPFPQISNSGS